MCASNEEPESVEEQPYIFDLNGGQATFRVLAHIATLLETHASVLVRNGYRPDLPGISAMHFGARMQQALAALEREEKSRTT